jgi:hypothetical protein
LATGLGLWISYGVFKQDFVTGVANSVGFSLVATLVGLKIRDTHGARDASPQQHDL